MARRKMAKLMAAESYRPPPPSINLHGAHAKALHGARPGSRISATVHGRLKNVGFDYENRPTAEIEVSKIARKRMAKKKASA